MRSWRLLLPGLLLPALLLPALLAGTGHAGPAEPALVDVPCTRPAQTAPPFDTGDCPGVRPGSAIQIETRLCSLGFLFKGSDGRKYAATAGHCVSVVTGEKTWAGTTGLAVKDAAGKTIGHVAYWVYQTWPGGRPRDFALIRIDNGVATNAEMCTFGGPTGLLSATDDGDFRQIHHVGAAGLVGALVSARTGLLRGMPDPNYVLGYALAFNGDSGSPVTDTSGKMIGLITQQAAGPGGTVGINRIGPHLDRARQQLRLRTLVLQTGTLR